ncbi:MAG: transcription elongation factor GreA [SAR324 cluster bacterium]|nr:transcription elongation factor GreA [SAR324 cluster bacterium]
MSEFIPITKIGLEGLKAELKRLLSEDRPAVKKDLAEARAHGDLSENAEYSAAKERQGFIEGRIQDINAKLPKLQVVDPALSNSEHVTFGATLTIVNVDTEEVSTYQIVGPDEADLRANKISFQSPIAKALIGKKLGDVVTIAIPRGTIEVEVTEIAYR